MGDNIDNIVDKSVFELNELTSFSSEDLLLVSHQDGGQWKSYKQKYSTLFSTVFYAAHPALQPIWIDHDPNEEYKARYGGKKFWLRSGELIDTTKDAGDYHDGLQRITTLLGDSSGWEDVDVVAGGVRVSAKRHSSGIMKTVDKPGLDFMFSATGSAWIYYWKDGMLMCPRTIYSFTGVRTASHAGLAVEAGLPDHQHDVVYQISNCSCAKPNGIRNSHDAKGKLGSVQTSTVGACSAYGASNPTVYGKSNTVQPPAVQMDLYFAV